MGTKTDTEGVSEKFFAEGKRDEWKAIVQSLNEKQYERTAHLLSNFQISKYDGDSHLTPILTTAQQICLVCRQVQAEIALHQQAYHESLQRERELQQQLTLILDLMEQQLESEFLPAQDSGQPDEADKKSSTKQTTEKENGRTWWQRLRTWFGAQSTKTATQIEQPVLASVEVVKETAVPSSPKESREDNLIPFLAVYCLGSFQVYEDDYLIDEWPSSKGKSIFKYLITHRHRPVPVNKEVLMDIFWPDANPDAARNNLNVAIYGLRQALRYGYSDFSHILFQNDCYMLNPELQVWVDVEEFTERFRSAQELVQHNQLEQAIQELHAAEELYRGDFLLEDRYENWLIPQRQKLHDTYLGLLDRLSSYYFDNQDYVVCITLCHKMLAVEPCREDTHRRLMRCYCRQNQQYLGLRQYHQCVEALRNELEVTPSPETVHLYEQIRRHELV